MPLLKYISMEIMRRCFHKAIEHNQFDLVKQLIKKGARINVTDEAGNTALHKAAIYGNHEIVRLLLENRAQVNGRNDQGFTALEISVIKGNYYCVLVLIQGGAEVNPMPTSYNKSKVPLHYATESGHVEIVKLLIRNGANLKAKDMDDKTALHYAVSSRSKYANYICEILLKNGVDIDAKDSGEKNTALSLAVKDHKCNEEVIQTILNFGANTDLKDAKFRLTPLETAGILANFKAVKILVENGLCPLKTRKMGYFNMSYNTLELAMLLYHVNQQNSQKVFKTMLYAMNRN